MIHVRVLFLLLALALLYFHCIFIGVHCDHHSFQSSSSSCTGGRCSQQSSGSSSNNGMTMDQQHASLNNVPEYAGCGLNGATSAAMGNPGGPTTVIINGNTKSFPRGPVIAVGDSCIYNNRQVNENGQTIDVPVNIQQTVQDYFKQQARQQEESLKKTFDEDFPFGSLRLDTVIPVIPPCPGCKCCASNPSPNEPSTSTRGTPKQPPIPSSGNGSPGPAGGPFDQPKKDGENGSGINGGGIKGGGIGQEVGYPTSGKKYRSLDAK